MSTQQRRSLAVIAATAVILAALSLVVSGAGGKKPIGPLTVDSVATIDLLRIQQKFPDYLKLQDVKNQLTAEYNAFEASQRQVLTAYYSELESLKDADLSAATDPAGRQAIEDKYDKLAREKATEMNRVLEKKQQEIQERFLGETQKAEERLREAVAAVGQSKNYKLVLMNNAVYHGENDITDLVVAKGEDMAKNAR